MSRWLRTIVAVAFLGLSSLSGCGTSAGRWLPGGLTGSAVLQTDGQDPADATGACCLPSGGCLTVTADDCDQFFGTFFGPGLICLIAPCDELL